MPPPLIALILGLALGSAATASAAWWIMRRFVRRTRQAERRARSAERMAEIGAMTGGLAHEIKNPLSTIGLNAQLLSEAIDELPIDPDERGRLSRRIAALRREADRLRGILTDFLQFAGEIRLDPAPADLNTLVEELADFFLPQAHKHGVRVRADLAPGPLLARIDAPLLKQALLNLMLNAVQSMAAPAHANTTNPMELILRTARASGPERDSSVILHVIDTGPGIPDAAIARIFEPYYTTKSGGTGLGLPTARRLVEAHGGRLEVHSHPGRGTDFAVILPAEEPH